MQSHLLAKYFAIPALFIAVAISVAAQEKNKVIIVLYMDVSVNHGPSYGDTLVWTEGNQPGLGEQKVVVQENLNKEKFYGEFIELMTHPTPEAK
jgi:hypothetical protein